LKPEKGYIFTMSMLIKKEKKLLVMVSIFYAAAVLSLSWMFHKQSMKGETERIDALLKSAVMSVEKMPENFMSRKNMEKLNAIYSGRIKEFSESMGIERIYAVQKKGGTYDYLFSGENTDSGKKIYIQDSNVFNETADLQIPVFKTHSANGIFYRSIYSPVKDGIIVAADYRYWRISSFNRISLIKSIVTGTLLILPIFAAFCYYRKVIRVREKNLLHELYHDHLTGLHNRNRLMADMENKTEGTLSAIMLDVNSFTQINSLYGQKAGDKLLRKIADAVKPLLYEGMDFYKLNADEFIIVVKNISNKRVIKLTEKILERVSQESYYIDGNDLFVTMRAGVALKFRKFSDLIASANLSRNLAKEVQCGYHIQNHSSRLKKNYRKNIEILEEIRHAIENSRIIPFYQPIINTRTGEIKKYEALIRIKKRNGEILTPDKFLHIAVTAKLYPKLAKIMIEEVCKKFQHTSVMVSLNFTTTELLNESVVRTLIKNIKDYSMSGRLILEIVESESIMKNTQVTRAISFLKSYGVQIAIDDFGSGYSNFNYLLDLQADYIKIDGSLIQNIEDKIESRIIVKSIVSFAHRLNMEVIGEFVSNENILALMKNMNVDYSQGYYVGEPSPDLNPLNPDMESHYSLYERATPPIPV